jgi:hypothetical protein
MHIPSIGNLGENEELHRNIENATSEDDMRRLTHRARKREHVCGPWMARVKSAVARDYIPTDMAYTQSAAADKPRKKLSA